MGGTRGQKAAMTKAFKAYKQETKRRLLSCEDVELKGRFCRKLK